MVLRLTLATDSLTWNQIYCNEQKELWLVLFVIYSCVVNRNGFSDTGRTGAFSWTAGVSGSWLLQDVMSMANYTARRANLNNVLSNTTLTPLQVAQYNHTLQMAGSGVPFVVPTYLSHGGVASAAQPNVGYGTLGAFILVSSWFMWVGQITNCPI